MEELKTSEAAQVNIGPTPPPELVNGQKVEDKSESELKASIAKRGQSSYYYAHNYDG